MRFLSFRTKEFYPLTQTMELENILFGTMTLGHRWQQGGNRSSEQKDVWVEPTVLPDTSIVQAIQNLLPGQMLLQDELVLAIRPLGLTELTPNYDDFQKWEEEYKKIEFEGPLEIITSLQYLITHNANQIIRDGGAGSLDLSEGKMNIPYKDFLLKNVIIDDRQGPVLIGEHTTILPGARIMGPVAILPHAVVKMGAEIYPGTTIGSRAVVNGEIKNSLIHEYSAKGHAGFLGDSIIGRWNNFGAGTITSNVSNTFSHVRYEDWNTGQRIQTDVLKRGLVTGDFVKLGIMTKTFRATAIGSFSSIATTEAVRGNVPAMTWWTEDQISKYEADLLREHCRRQMQLRGIEWNEKWEWSLQGLLSENIDHPRGKEE